MRLVNIEARRKGAESDTESDEIIICGEKGSMDGGGGDSMAHRVSPGCFGGDEEHKWGGERKRNFQGCKLAMSLDSWKTHGWEQMRQRAGNREGGKDVDPAAIAEGWRSAAAPQWRHADWQKIPNEKLKMFNFKRSASVVARVRNYSIRVAYRSALWRHHIPRGVSRSRGYYQFT